MAKKREEVVVMPEAADEVRNSALALPRPVDYLIVVENAVIERLEMAVLARSETEARAIATQWLTQGLRVTRR